jgi:hypothetical protein
MDIKIHKNDKPEVKALKIVIKEKNFTVIQVAKIIDRTERTIYHWLEGDRYILVNIVKAIAQLQKAKANL